MRLHTSPSLTIVCHSVTLFTSSLKNLTQNKQVRQTWDLLTSDKGGDFNPLELCTKLDPLLTSIAGLNSSMSTASPVKDLHMDQYTTPLKQVREQGQGGGS